MASADEILKAAAATYAERNTVYGNNWVRIGNMLHGMFPDGITLITPEDHIRFYHVVQMVTKLTRYGKNFDKGGHKDSARDMCVYAAMMEAYDDKKT